MVVPEERRGRAHDAKGAREAILNAAEKVFAEHGFDGARIAAIAAEAGYNSSLIFQYFGDKLGLYTAVLKRIDEQAGQVRAESFEPVFADEAIVSDAHTFRTLLETAIRTIFDFLVEHPRLVRIYAWEEAEGWQTYAKTSSPSDARDIELFQTLFTRAQKAGLIRPSLDPAIMVNIVTDICLSYQTALPRYQVTMKDRDFSSPEMLTRAREQIVDVLVHGIMVDPPETHA
jgi:TetR/AcrR family transcriptional regulator